MAETGSAVVDFGPIVVAAAGTRVALPTVGTLTGNPGDAAKTVTIQALTTNEGKIAVGGPAVVAAVGTHASPKTRGTLLNAGDTISLDVDDLSTIQIDATVTGDGISGTVLLA
jgi:hypothetical protein